MRLGGPAAVLWSIVLCCAGGAQAAAVTKADYARAEGMDLRNKLKNALIVPHWIGPGDEFWYRRDTPGGREFVRVEAATGRRTPAFDHSALAEALSKVLGKAVLADNLPLESVELATGQEAVIVVQVEDKSFECELSPEAGCRPVDPAPSGLSISPDGAWGLLVRESNLWVRDLRSGEERALTTDGEADFGYGIETDFLTDTLIPQQRENRAVPPVAALWSPDSRTVVVPRVDQRDVGWYPFIETVPLDGSFRPRLYRKRLPFVGEKLPIRHWFAFDVQTGSSRRLRLPELEEETDWTPSATLDRRAWWSADSRRLFLAESAEDMRAAFLFDIDVTTGEVRTVLEERLTPRVELNTSANAAPNIHVTADGRDVIWFSQRDGWGHLYLYDGRTGRLRGQITRGEWLVRDIVHVDEEKRRIFFTGVGREGGNPYYRYLYRVNFDGSQLTLLTPEPADHPISGREQAEISRGAIGGEHVISPNGRYLVYGYSTPKDPGATVLRSVSDGRRIATLEKPDTSAMSAAGYRPPEEFVVKAADGKTDLWGVLYLPSQFDPLKRYPLIDHQYTSPFMGVAPRSFRDALRGSEVAFIPAPSLAELGFAVMVIDARGTPNRSREFQHGTHPWYPVMGLDDHVAAIRQLAERFPYVDATRVGIIGVSMGGLAAVQAMLQFPEVFKAGVAGWPATVRHNHYRFLYPTYGRPVYSDGGSLRPTPTEKPQNWSGLDATQHVSRLEGRLLMIMGELDENVLPSSTLGFADALMKADKPFDLIYLPSTAHNVGQYRTYVTRRSYDHLVRHLLGAEPPGN